MGAGASGLAAASALAREGLSVRVLEARDRPGGRIRTVRDGRTAAPVELGAEFVHGGAPLTRALLARAGATTIRVEARSWEARGGSLRPARVWDRVERVLSGLDPDRRPDRSLAEHLRARTSTLAPEDARAAKAFVEGFFAADAERIGERALAGEAGAEGAREADRIPDGYDSIVRVLAEDLDVATVRVVEEVAWRRGEVRVSGASAGSGRALRPVRARSAVLTLPLGVLGAAPGTGGRPEIDPWPDRWSVAMAGLEMGAAVRLVLLFERPVPELFGEVAGGDAFDGFLHAPSRSPHVFWTLSPLSDRALVAWAGGPRALGLPRETNALAARTLDVLAGASGVRRETLAGSLVGALHHDWLGDPWARGAYAYPLVGGEGAPEALRRPVEGTLFLAGEAASEEAMGTVEGALESGVRAAEAVLAALGRDGS